jgi:hypothetical protein
MSGLLSPINEQSCSPSPECQAHCIFDVDVVFVEEGEQITRKREGVKWGLSGITRS